MAEVDDEEAVGLTAEEQEEAMKVAAENASYELLAFSRENNSALALQSLEIATEVDRTEQGSYWTPLHYGAFNGDARLVDGLIARGAHKVYMVYSVRFLHFISHLFQSYNTKRNISKPRNAKSEKQKAKEQEWRIMKKKPTLVCFSTPHYIGLHSRDTWPQP
jgi:hypothetical protein